MSVNGKGISVDKISARILNNLTDEQRSQHNTPNQQVFLKKLFIRLLKIYILKITLDK